MFYLPLLTNCVLVSPHVIFLGLDPDFTEADVSPFLFQVVFFDSYTLSTSCRNSCKAKAALSKLSPSSEIGTQALAPSQNCLLLCPNEIHRWILRSIQRLWLRPVPVHRRRKSVRRSEFPLYFRPTSSFFWCIRGRCVLEIRREWRITWRKKGQN